MKLYPPKGDALFDYRDSLRTMTTADLLRDTEYYEFELLDLEVAIGVDFAEQSREYFDFKLRELALELRRRETLKHNRPLAEWANVPAPKRERYEAVKAAIDLATFIADATSHVFRPSGQGRVVTHCPLRIHEDRTPSFTVYPNQSFYCFGCGIGGSIIDFCIAYYRLTRDEALVAAEEEAGITATPTRKPIVVHREGGETPL